ncbi:MFS transporter [Novosphingobium terrae]|uniref:MFS transporter n=1 Tax=Novosphingobium terrae TaxID=2726189 RepID=UPI0019809CBE|nr:MFS transporter [Novosphingobium terrae]
MTPAQQRHTVIACFLGWALDAFDFFILIFVMADIAREFGTTITGITWALTLTLGLRVVGAYIFGRLADRFGRRPTLLVNVLLFSALSFASGFANSLWMFLTLRSLYGVAMGGEWGIGTSLAMESIDAKWRGMVSGLLQAGYPVGYLLAALAYGLGFHWLGWRGLFMITMIPAALIFYIRRSVPESPAWEKGTVSAPAEIGLIATLRQHAGLIVMATLLMAAASTFSHGTQDLYPTYLRVQHGLPITTISAIAVVYNLGAIFGSLLGGSLSQIIGRRRQLIVASLAALALLPFWATVNGPVAIGAMAFAMQFLVQSTFGVLPAHLNEIAPANVRSTFTGVVYQLGNLLTAGNATLQAWLAERYMHGHYGSAMAIVVAAGALLLALLAAVGQEAREKSLVAPA